ncbi:[4Fe-4S] proteins maturation [Rhodotorula sphaerocarpa]
MSTQHCIRCTARLSALYRSAGAASSSVSSSSSLAVAGSAFRSSRAAQRWTPSTALQTRALHASRPAAAGPSTGGTLAAASRRPASAAAAARTPRSPPPPSSRVLGGTFVGRRFIACSAQPPPNPSEDFEPVEEELKEGETLEMHLTEAAIKQIERAQAKANDRGLNLRLMVESGGCHGYHLFAPPTDTTAALLVDCASLPLVKGSTIDYATELIGSAFKIRDNPQSKDAGCGCGVSWELKDM